MTASPVDEIGQLGVPEQFADSARDLVLSYLVHNRYEETAKSFASAVYNAESHSQPSGKAEISAVSDMKGSIEIVDQDGDIDMSEATSATKVGASGRESITQLLKWLNIRKTICSLILEGKIDMAIKKCQLAFPDLLASPLDAEVSRKSFDIQKSGIGKNISPLLLSFELNCQQFIEFVRKDQQAEALNYAQTVLSKFGLANSKFLPTLRDVVALIAYQNPAESPVAHYLGQEQRECVANLVNSAIMVSLKQPSLPSLEAIVRQYAVIREFVPSAEGISSQQKKAQQKKWTLQDLMREVF